MDTRVLGGMVMGMAIKGETKKEEQITDTVAG
jgi:hypothetical protein